MDASGSDLDQRRRGDGDAAVTHIATAVQMFREMGMSYWLEKAEAEMGEL